MGEILIKNGTVVNATGWSKSDIHVVDDRVQAVTSRIERPGATVIDAKDCYIFPGGVDPHVHMELPLGDFSSSDTFESGTRAALMGGTTTILDFANQKRGDTLKQALDLWHQKADGKACCDYGFHISVTDWNETTRKEIQDCIQAGVTSFKVFMAYPDRMMLADRSIVALMDDLKRSGGLLQVHAENGDLIEFLSNKNRATGNKSAGYHGMSRPVLAEAEAVSRIVDLATAMNCPLYIVHLSSAAALERVSAARLRAPLPAPLFVETCIQYLLLEDARSFDHGVEGAKFVLSPPLRTRKDMDQLWMGLGEGKIQVVATDHCPFTTEQKARGKDDFALIPNGLPGVEHRMELLYSDGVVNGRISLSQFVELTSASAAKIFGLFPKKGAIQPGADADIVIFDPNAGHVISAKTHHMNVDYSPYEGWKTRGRVRTVLLRGKVVADQGKFLGAAGGGKFLPRAKFSRHNVKL